MMNDSDNAQKDFEYSRKTYIDLIKKGETALDEMLTLATALEHPKAFETAAMIIKNIADVNMRLVDLHKKRKEYNRSEKPEEISDQNTTTNNNVFIGSTTDLQKMLQSVHKEQIEGNVVDISPHLKDK
jgi:hypothetical protein